MARFFALLRTLINMGLPSSGRRGARPARREECAYREYVRPLSGRPAQPRAGYLGDQNGNCILVRVLSSMLCVTVGSIAPALGKTDDGAAERATMAEVLSHQDYGSAWTFTVGLGLIDVSGNTDASSLTPTLGFTVVGADWALAVTGSGTHIEKERVNIAESYESHAMVHRRLVGNITWVGLHDAERDRFKGLDLRSTLGTGLAWLARNGDGWKATVGAGAAWEYEDFIPASGLANDGYATANLYLKNTFSLSSGSTLIQTASSNIGRDSQRIDGDLKLETVVTEWLHVVLSYEVEYDDDPHRDVFAQTDRTFTASLTVNLSGG